MALVNLRGVLQLMELLHCRGPWLALRALLYPEIGLLQVDTIPLSLLSKVMQPGEDYAIILRPQNSQHRTAEHGSNYQY